MRRSVPRLVDVLSMAHELGRTVDKYSAAFNRSVLLIVFGVAVTLSLHGFLFSPSSWGGWMYLCLALLTALSLEAFERVPAYRSCTIAVPVTTLGASFLVLDFRSRLGWLVVAGTLLASTPLVVLEVMRARPGRHVHQAASIKRNRTPQTSTSSSET
ncbi:MAG: hypothetical protein OXK76_08375 [Gammaproteobacteria bacterium]|nr:hypothetical protein [Gammaproteobacteria bacterium]